MIQGEHADAAIVFHSADDSETALLDAVDAGATAYLTKDATADQIIEAVRKASRGEVLIPVELFARAIARQRRVVTFKKRELRSSHSWRSSRLAELNILHLKGYRGRGTNRVCLKVSGSHRTQSSGTSGTSSKSCRSTPSSRPSSRQREKA